MNSRKTNWKLIENITVEVPNTQSISKNVLFHVSKFACFCKFDFSDFAVFLLSSLVTGPSLILISLLVLELW